MERKKEGVSMQDEVGKQNPHYKLTSRADYFNTGTPTDLTSGHGFTKTFVNYYSPETTMNIPSSLLEGTKLQLCSMLVDDVGNDLNGTDDQQLVVKLRKSEPITETSGSSQNIGEVQKTGYSFGTIYDFGGTEVRNYVLLQYDTSPDKFYKSYHGTNLTIKLNSAYTNDFSTSAGYMLANYRKTVTNQYGGNTHEARSNREYIRASNSGTVSTSQTITCNNGDTYVTMFDYLRQGWDDDAQTDDRKSQEVLYFPVETSVNTYLRHDTPFHQLSTYRLHETTAVGVALFDTDYPSEATDLYLYNSVYSKQDTFIKDLPKPINFVDNSRSRNLISASNKKVNGETIDNWTIFLQNNNIEVDGTYGEINDLKMFKERLYFFQTRAFGYVNVNPRITQTDDNGITAQLGTGDVLNDYRNISTEVGCSNRFGATLMTRHSIWICQTTGNRTTRS
jgi:hypothetical protein